jgi:hypothetical protein
MRATAPAAELAQGYEALRAQATGRAPRRCPRGLAVLLRGGLASWMCACPPESRARPAAEAAPGAREAGAREARAGSAASAELVRLLAGMTLSSQRRYAA